jgi:hypothetical protein
MADLKSARRSLQAALARRDAQARSLTDITKRLMAERERLRQAQQAGNTDQLSTANARIRELGVQRAAAVKAIASLHDQIRAGVDAQLGTLLHLEGDVPLALLPVRLEARSTADGKSLRVRIFHDALHTQSLEEGLSEPERAAGIDYWTAVWRDGDPKAPWNALVAAVGRQRAPWIAEVLRPKNIALRPAGSPDFPATAGKSGRPAVARTLPDRFFVRIEQEGAAPITAHGATIPDELPVGLTERDGLSPLKVDGEDLPPIDAGLRWLVDYSEAERLGMAVTVPLPLPGKPIMRVLAYGVRASLDAAAGAQRMAQLIRAHQFTDGAEFIAQGTPTNNTESARTSWSRRTPAGPPQLTPAEGATPGSNAAITARAFGVAAETLSGLANGSDGEQTRAAAMNSALWTTTWADAIEHLTPQGRANGDKRLDSPSLDAVRDHWIAHVRGRGPLPAIRLGRQPYGILPLVNTDGSWRPRHGGFIENSLVPFIDRQIRWMWRDGLANVPTIMNRPLDTALPEILGTDAVCRGLRVRSALSPDPVINGITPILMPDLGKGSDGATRTLEMLSAIDNDALDSHYILGGKTRTLALPLVHTSDPDYIANLLAPAPAILEVKSVLQVLLRHAAAVEQHLRDSTVPASGHGMLSNAIERQEGIEKQLVSAAVDSALAGDFRARNDALIAKAAAHVTTAVGRLDLRMVADRHPVASIAPPTVLQQLAGDIPKQSRLTGNLAMQVVGELLHRTQRAAQFRSALEELGAIGSIDERRLLLAETLDCCSHRLDAWITSAAALRLDNIRSDVPQGLALGAYGWLENLELYTPTAAGQVDGRDVLHEAGDGGFIHAPGLTHATTAAVLRSGRLTHRRGDPNATAMDIDLSSTRMRDALGLLEGIRQGQPLGALLGYRLERRLHEQSDEDQELDRFIYVLRSLAPLRTGKLTAPGEAVQESVAASDVVDGLELMQLDDRTVRQKLKTGPTDQRYIVPPDKWKGPSQAEEDAVMAAIAELESSHDAVADLLLAESVHQLVSGNPARAAAAMDALGAGEAAPPEPEVVRTPRTGVTIQYRLAILVPVGVTPRPVAWNPRAPRAVAEPALEGWAQGALGDPTTLHLAVGSEATLSQSGLCALDVLYDSDSDSVGNSRLAARLRAVIADLGEDLSPLAPVWELGGMLRTMISSARTLTASDLGATQAAGAASRRVDAEEILARANAALDSLRAVAIYPAPLDVLAGFGIWPITGDAALEPLFDDAARRVAAAAALLDRVKPTTSPKEVIELAGQAITAIFGQGFLALPILQAPAPGDIDQWAGALGPAGVRPRPGADIRPWLARAGTIRPATSTYGETLLVREAMSLRPVLRALQYPVSAFPTWAGLPFADGRPPQTPLTSVVAEVVGGADSTSEALLNGPLAGVILDEWIEVVPRRIERLDPDNPDAPGEMADVTTTGLALNANAPGARPPQAILLALSPDGKDWTGERLVHALEEALTLAKMRTITLQNLPCAGLQLPALYFRDWSLQGEPTIDWSTVARTYDQKSVIQFLDTTK